ncbi:hypothetical protein TNCV_13091 [Trichonephila clavipes]|nr:hypothetical protein TNCV_13091 [Trichonephila clavipes]
MFYTWLECQYQLGKKRNWGLSTVNQEHDQRRLRRIVRQNRDSNVLQLTQIANQGSSQQISSGTMRRELKRIGIHSRVPLRKSLISARNAKIRLQWCREGRHWTTEDWKRVMRSNESHNNLFW